MHQNKGEISNKRKCYLKPKRAVPFTALKQLNEEMDRLEKRGAIKKDWLYWMGIFNRLCIYIYIYKIRVFKDFSTDLNDEAVYQVRKNFLHKRMEENVVKVGPIWSIPARTSWVVFKTIDNKHRRLYKFSRLPFDLKIAPSIFQ